MNIEKRTTESGKTYEFDESHDSRMPAQFWLQNPPEGLTLFIVFYTLACRWSKCTGCNLPSKMSRSHVFFGDIMCQVDYVFKEIITDEKKANLRKIIISNNGSILDEDTFSTTALIYFISMMNLHCPNIDILSIETRPEYIDWGELEVISRAIKEGETPTELEVVIGFEAFDEEIRNKFFVKGMPLKSFEDMVEKVAKYNFKLKTYFMQKPVPGISEEEAIEDIKKAIDYLDSIAHRFSVNINMHLNPTYVAYGTQLEEAFKDGAYEPPLLESVRKAALYGNGKNISIFIGLNDEGLAVEGGSFIRKGDESLVKKFEKFNHTQDYDLLK
ncbi:hypothetical protein ACFL20_05095 [Spirochaetota bacterium]